MRAVMGVEFQQGIEEAWSNVATFVPQLLAFLAILIIGYFVAKVIAKIADKALERVGFDRAVERGGIKKALSRSQYDASTILSKVIFYALFLIVLQMAFGVFGQNPVSDLLAAVISYLPLVIVAILIIVVSAAIAAAAKMVIDSTLGGLSYGNILANVASGAIIAIGGGGIGPMRQQWEKAMNKAQEEAPRVRQASEGGQQRVQADLRDKAQQAKGAASQSRQSSQAGR